MTDRGTSTAKAIERMARGTADGTSRRTRAAFIEDPELERLSELAATDPESFRKLGPDMRIRVGFYVEAKRRSKRA